MKADPTGLSRSHWRNTGILLLRHTQGQDDGFSFVLPASKVVGSFVGSKNGGSGAPGRGLTSMRSELETP